MTGIHPGGYYLNFLNLIILPVDLLMGFLINRINTVSQFSSSSTVLELELYLTPTDKDIQILYCLVFPVSKNKYLILHFLPST